MAGILKEGVRTSEIETEVLIRSMPKEECWKVQRVPLPRRVQSAPLMNLGSFSCEGGSCIVGGVLVRMANETLRPIETLQSGDVVRSLFGTAVVARVDETKLGVTRRVIELANGLDEPLMMSDDHPIWTKIQGPSGDEGWGTYNASHYLYEKELYDGYPEVDASFLRFDRPNVHAHVDGWVAAQPIYHLMEPTTPLYNLILETGDGFIAGGYVVFSHALGARFEGVQWMGLQVTATGVA